MTVTKKLDKASGLFFFGGFLISKLQYVPIPLVSAISATLKFVGLGIYMIAYGLWFIANLLRPDHKQAQNKWYGFAQFKEQLLLSSFFGFAATSLSVAAVFVTVLFPIAAWFFVIGNMFWTIGEYHKLNNPPQNDDNFSYTRQKAFTSYSTTITSISMISAIAATLVTLFPPFAISITIFSLLICAGLGALSFEFWLDSNLGDHELTPPPNSYSQMSDVLKPTFSFDLSKSPKPQDSNSFPQKDNPKHSETELTTELTTELSEEDTDTIGLEQLFLYN